MATSSRFKGFLRPTIPVPEFDQALDDLLNPTIAGILGLNGDLWVRPRFQESAPAQPDRNTPWVAFGVNRTISDTYQAVRQTNSGAAVIRYQILEVLLSFYGPTADAMAAEFRDGLLISQNRYLLTQGDIGVVDIGESRKVPALFKEKWLTKVDMNLTLSRQTERLYPVEVLLSAGITLNTDPVGNTPLAINIIP